MYTIEPRLQPRNFAQRMTLKGNLGFIPALEVFNHRPKTTMTVQRDGNVVVINPQTSMGLQDGDVLYVTSGAPMVCVYRA